VAGAETTATASRNQARPSRTAITATFNEDLRRTYYDVDLSDPAGAVTIWKWDFAAPPDDPTCNAF
jgi:hypothetical protein